MPAGTIFFRVYFRASRHPMNWRSFRTYGPTDVRFDHHLRPAHEQERGILYVAIHPRTALAEVFQRRRTINTRRMDPWLVALDGCRAETSRFDGVVADAGRCLDGSLYRTSRADSSVVTRGVRGLSRTPRALVRLVHG